MWAHRATVETRRAARTWFGTLTIEPQVQYVHLARARQRAEARATPWETLSEAEQFAALQSESGREVTLMLKRLRKATKAPFVYLCVAEAHKSGLPHYHLLIHERSDVQPIRKTALDAEWRIGFCKWRLVRDVREATYLCKYLSKSTMARVRASVDYGEENVLEHSANVSKGDPAPPPRPAGSAEAGRPGTPSLGGPPTPPPVAFVVAAYQEGLFNMERIEHGNSISATEPGAAVAGQAFEAGDIAASTVAADTE